MKDKKSGRKDLKNVCLTICSYLITTLIVVICSKKNSIFYMSLIISCLFIVHHLVCRKVVRQELKKCRYVFEVLKNIHATRYACCLEGSTEEEISKYSEVFEICAKAVLATGNILIKNEKATKKERKEIEDIMKQTEALTMNINPFA